MSPDIPTRRIAAGELLQHVSRTLYRGSALYFSAEGANRYDDPKRSYGVLYLGFDLPTVLMESVFHRHRWHTGRRRVITLSEVERRIVRAVGTLQALSLADLAAPGVMAAQFGLNLSQLASRRYVHIQRLSAWVHAETNAAGAPRFDGLLYPSRNNHPACCIALFERARPKVTLIDDIDLRDHVDWPAFVAAYRIVVLPV